MVTVHNLATDDQYIFVGLTPRQAVISAYAYANGDCRTWEYESRYGSLVTTGRKSAACGDFSALL
jgi:hypothetical protein